MSDKGINLHKQNAMGHRPKVSGSGKSPMPMMKDGGMVKCYKKGGKVYHDHVSGHKGKHHDHIA